MFRFDTNERFSKVDIDLVISIKMLIYFYNRLRVIYCNVYHGKYLYV